MHAHPPFKERAAQGCMQNEKITFRSTLLKAQILGAFTYAISGRSLLPARGRWRERLRVKLRVRLQVQLRSRPPWLKAAAAAAVATSATGQ